MKTIVIQGWYGHNNLGDELILDIMIDELKRLNPDKELDFIVLSSASANVTNWGKIKSIDYSKDLRRHYSVIKAIKKADLFLLGGGGYLFEPPRSRLPLGILYYLYPVIIAKIFKKPVLTYAIGLGPIYSGLGKFIVRKVFGQIDLITVRDASSKALLQNIGVHNADIHVTADPVVRLGLRFNSHPKTAEKTVQNEKYVAFCPSSLDLESFQALDRVTRERAIDVLARAADDIIRQHGVATVFVPMQISDHKNDDRAIISGIHRKMQCKDQALVVSESSFYEKAAIIQKAEMVIGMRFHSVIIASSACVPVIGICHAPKMRDYLVRTGNEQYCIDFKDLEYPCMISMIDDLWSHRPEIKKRLEAIMPDVVRQAHSSAELIRDFMNNPNFQE